MHKSNLHVLIIPSWYPHFEGDIRGSFFREQALALKKEGHTVGIIYPQFRSVKNIKGIFLEPYGIKYVNDSSIHTYKYYSLALPKLNKIQQKRWIRLGLQLFEQYVKKFGIPDIIHVHSLHPAGYLALAIKSKYKIPFVVTEHSSMFVNGLIKKKELLKLRNVVCSSDYNIAVSQSFCNLLDSIFEVKSWEYIPNIVNNNFFSIQSEVPKKIFRYLTVSLLTEQKAVDNLIEAFSYIRNEIPNAVLHIGGDGVKRASLERLVKNLNLEDKVVFLGKLSREKVKAEMAKCSVFVLPSRYETFGVVLIESLALGRPVIATKCGGPQSIVKDGVGLLVEVDDINALSKAMLDTYINYDKYNLKDIREYCIDNFSEEAVAFRLSNVYKSVLYGSSQ